MPEERWAWKHGLRKLLVPSSDALKDGPTQDGNIARARLMRVDLLIGIAE